MSTLRITSPNIVNLFARNIPVAPPRSRLTLPKPGLCFCPRTSSYRRGRYLLNCYLIISPLTSIHSNRSIVQERSPSFQGSFVKTCLLLIGKISGVWGSLASISSDHAHSPAEGSAGASDRPPSGANSMLDMLMAPSGRRATCARVSAREAFRFVGKIFGTFQGCDSIGY